MFALRLLGRSIDTLLDRIFSVVGAIALSQIPELIGRYYDALGGVLLEANRNLDAFRAQARLVGKSLEDMIQIQLGNADPVIQGAGKALQQAVDRYETYQQAYDALGDASIFTRPFTFLYYVDWELFNTLTFKIGVPLTVEGIVYAFLGILIGLGVYHGVVRLPVYLFGGKDSASNT